jgi:hypothetical protein
MARAPTTSQCYAVPRRKVRHNAQTVYCERTHLPEFSPTHLAAAPTRTNRLRWQPPSFPLTQGLTVRPAPLPYIQQTQGEKLCPFVSPISPSAPPLRTLSRSTPFPTIAWAISLFSTLRAHTPPKPAHLPSGAAALRRSLAPLQDAQHPGPEPAHLPPTPCPTSTYRRAHNSEKPAHLPRLQSKSEIRRSEIPLLLYSYRESRRSLAPVIP